MDPLEVDGKWWLPEATDRRVGGRLRLNRREFALVLDDRLLGPEAPSGTTVSPTLVDVERPVIHGRARDGTAMTLLECTGWVRPYRDDDPQQETYHPNAVLLGAHLHHADDLAFQRVWCSFDHLTDWARVRGIEHKLESGDGRADRVIVDARGEQVAQADVDGWRIQLIADLNFSLGEREVNILKKASFVAEMTKPIDWETAFSSIVGPLGDLVSFATTRVTAVNDVYLRPSSATNYRDPNVELRLRALQLEMERSAVEHLIPRQMLFSISDLPESFADFLQRWFTLRSDLSAVLDPLFAARNAPFLYAETRFLLLAQAAEILHREVIGGSRLPAEEHNRRVNAVVTSAPKELKQWADDIVRPANFLRFAERLEALIGRVGDVGTDILNASPEFVRRVVKTRNYLTHQDEEKDVLGSASRHWHGEALKWIISTGIMLELGFAEPRAVELIRQNLSYPRQLQALRDAATDYSS